MGGVIFLAVVAAVVFWVIVAYNGLISLKNQVANAWKQIDVQLRRRHDLIPNLVNTVKGAIQHERDTLEAVVAARNQAIKVEREGAGVAQTAAVEAQLTGALSRLLVVVEAYPQLRAQENVKGLQEELTSTENRISFARQLYNDTATLYNTRQQQFPTNLITGLAKATQVELWEIEDASERKVPKADISYAPRSDSAARSGQ